MKKLLCVILQLLAASYSYAQNTAWPSAMSTSSVGIGTTSPAPAAKLDVYGAIAIGGTIVNASQVISTPADQTYVLASGPRIRGTYTLTFEGNNRVQTIVLFVNACKFDGNSSLSILTNNSYINNQVMSNFRLLLSGENAYLAFDVSNRAGGTSIMPISMEQTLAAQTGEGLILLAKLKRVFIR